MLLSRAVEPTALAVNDEPRAPSTKPAGVHLVGSIPLADSGEVFVAVSEILGRFVRRMPDGETGKRSRWNSWTAPTYERTEGLVLVDPPEGSYTPWKQARLAVDPGELVLERLGFADAALASYERFAELKGAGVIPEHARFQVCLPSPVAPMIILIEEGSRAAVEPAHVRQLHSEIGEMLDGIPHDQLSIQWDVCQDVGILEGYYPAYFDRPEDGVIARLAQCAEAVPDDVELGYHLCYGDFRHKHFMEPANLGVCTAIMNRLSSEASRSIDWFHVPVPIERDDDAYFAPLDELRLDPGTELYLGLVHAGDGEEGAERRIETARRHASGFGIATECGFGRRPPESIEPLMTLHAQLSAPIA